MATKRNRTIASALAGLILLTGAGVASSAAAATPPSGPASAAAQDKQADIAFTHTAKATLWNDTGRTMPLISAEKSSRDSWSIRPLPELMRKTWGNSDWPHIDGVGRINNWQTASGFMRGAWNVVKYGDDRGTVTLTVNNPFSAASTWKCETTGDLRCVSPKLKGWIWELPNVGSVGLNGGAELDVHFYICSANERQTPATPGGCPR